MKPDDIPLTVAVSAAALVAEKWLPGVKTSAAAKLVEAMAATLRRYPDSKPETLWISVQADAGFAPWDAAPYAVQKAFGVFRAVLLAMDEGLAPEPAPAVPNPGEKHPLRTVFDKKPKLADLVQR